MQAQRLGDKNCMHQRGPAAGAAAASASSLMRPISATDSSASADAVCEEGNAQLAFELGNLPAQRRLRDMQRVRGAGHVALVRHGQEVAQLPQLHYMRSARSSVRRAVSSQPRHGSVMDLP